MDEPARLVSTQTSKLDIVVKGTVIRVSREGRSEPRGLPGIVEGRFLIVSRAVAERYPHRHDLVFPTGIERDPATGAITACRGLGTLVDLSSRL